MPFVPPASWLRHNREKALAKLDELMRLSVEQRLAGRVPALYSTGIRYKREPRGIDQWLTAEETYAHGMGDCEDLAVWLAADHIVAGDPSACVVIKPVRPGLDHALVMTGDGKVLRDPSRILGMLGKG